jgi:hypothetical protein
VCIGLGYGLCLELDFGLWVDLGHGLCLELGYGWFGLSWVMYWFGLWVMS